MIVKGFLSTPNTRWFLANKVYRNAFKVIYITNPINNIIARCDDSFSIIKKLGYQAETIGQQHTARPIDARPDE